MADRIPVDPRSKPASHAERHIDRTTNAHNARLGPDGFRRLCESVRFPADQPPTSSPREVKERRKAALSLRANLLGTALRASEAVTPEIVSVVRETCERLRLPEVPETFVMAGSGELNAFCVSAGISDVRLLGLNGELFEWLDREELIAVVAHELGHMALHTGGGGRSESFLDELHESAASRCREISADRVSALAVEPSVAFRMMVKMHTNLRSTHFRLDIGALVQQAADMPPHDAVWQLTTSHPFLSFRVWALNRFIASDAMCRHRGAAGGEPLKDIDDEIAARLEMLGGGRLSLTHADLVNEALVWLSLLLVHEDGQITDAEQRELVEMVGRIRATNAIEVLKHHGRMEIESHARRTTEAALAAGPHVMNRLMRALDDLGAAVGVDVSASRAAALVQDITRKAAH
jgi:hypothetical protein